MLILVLSDIHGRVEKIKKIVSLLHNQGVELALVLGDLTNLGGEKQAEDVLNALKGFEAMAIAGNFDTMEVARFLERRGVSLHGKARKVGEWSFAGFGGGLVGSPGGFLFSEEDIKAGLENALAKKSSAILATHLPPFGTGIDKCYTGAHVGSKAVRKIIEDFKPALHLCGHCHEASGEAKIGETKSINVGAVSEGKALLLDLGKELKWERIQV